MNKDHLLDPSLSDSATTHEAAKRFPDNWFDGMYNDHVAEFYEHSDFYNFGYWGDGAVSQREASERLVDKLLEFIPEKHGTILDVACGKGATTRHLLKCFSPTNVTGINLSARQIESCCENVPQCTFLQMDAAQLQFRPDCFDNLICVEAAFMFRTRRSFLSHALRVLKPGGWLVIADILVGVEPNKETTAEEYGDLLRALGFVNVHEYDCTDQCLVEHRKRLRRFGVRKFLANPQLGEEQRRKFLGYQLALLSMKGYVLAHARKPDG